MSKNKSLLAIAKRQGEKIADELGYDLVDVEYVKENEHFYLRVFMDKKGGIGLDDCQIVSERLSKVLDENDPSDESYFLEVSSPGLDRPLKTDKDYERNIGKDVELKLYKSFQDRKQLEGNLLSFDNDFFNIELESGEIMEIPRTIVSLMRLVIKF